MRVQYQVQLYQLKSMGNKDSKNTNSEAGWRYVSYCDCKIQHYRVYCVVWKSVPMPAEGWVTTGRILSLGITQFWAKGQQFSHDAVEAWISCDKCGKSEMVVTMEFAQFGKRLRWGWYTRKKSDGNAKISKQRNYSYSVVEKQYDRMWDSGYDLTDNNCKRWAKSLYSDL